MPCISLKLFCPDCKAIVVVSLSILIAIIAVEGNQGKSKDSNGEHNVRELLIVFLLMHA